MRIAALDYGRKRVGLALSDPLQMISQPKGYLSNDSKLYSQLKEFISENEVSQVVVGIPPSLKGSDSEMTREVRSFVEKLKSEIELPITEWDERLTTQAAEKALIEGDVKRGKRKELRDA